MLRFGDLLMWRCVRCHKPYPLSFTSRALAFKADDGLVCRWCAIPLLPKPKGA